MVNGGYAKDPVLVAEILSPSTMNNDRGRKLDFYTTIASLETILIVYQGRGASRSLAAYQQRMEQRRSAGIEPIASRSGRFGSIGVADIYEGVPLA